MSEQLKQALAYADFIVPIADRDTPPSVAEAFAAGWQASRAQPAQAVPLLTEREIVKCLTASGCVGTVKMSYDSGPYEITRTSVNADRFARAIESLVRSKLGAGVPMRGDDIYRIARRLAPKVVDGMVYVPEWIVPLVRAVEESHGIVGKEGA